MHQWCEAETTNWPNENWTTTGERRTLGYQAQISIILVHNNKKSNKLIYRIVWFHKVKADATNIDKVKKCIS